MSPLSDLNRRPTRYECVALPAELRGRIKRVTGIEPVTQPWEGRILPLNHTRPLALTIINEKKIFFQSNYPGRFGRGFLPSDGLAGQGGKIFLFEGD